MTKQPCVYNTCAVVSVHRMGVCLLVLYFAFTGIWGVSLAILLAQYRTLRRYSHLHVDAAGAHADDDPAATIQGQDHAEDGTVKPPRLVDLPAPQMG